MMDSKNKNFNSGTDQRTGVPVSPFLNFDPAYIGQTSDYIYPEGSKPRRGHLEMAFTKIGASILFGASVGGLMGATSGFKELKSSGFNAGKGNQYFNLVKKQGGEFAQKAGVIVLAYSFIEVMGSNIFENHEMNYLVSGTLTGFVCTFRGSARQKVTGIAAGLAFGSILCLLENKDRIKSMLSR